MITYSINAVPLDRPASGWKLLKGTLITPALTSRSNDVSVPGFDGFLPVAYEVSDAPTLGLRVEVKGATDAQMNSRLSDLLGLFADLRKAGQFVVKTDDAGSKTAEAKLVSVSEPEYSPVRHVAIVTAILRLPRVYWRGATADYSRLHPLMGQAYRVTTLDGMSGPVDDALILVTGPIANPRITDVNSGEWVQASFAVAAGEKLLINCATWEARRGTAVSYAGGGSIVSQTLSASRGRAVLLRLASVVTAGVPSDRRVSVALSGTGDNADTTLGIRAQPAYFS